MLNNNLIIAFIKNILAAKYDIRSEKVKGVYLYGSRLYGVADEKSDYDYIVIVDMIKNDYLQYESKELDIHVISESYYKKLLDKHSIMALEVYYQKSPIMPYEADMDFKVDPIILRHSIAAIASNSWVKAKKKVILDNENDYIGYKSLFHSFRIPMFAIEILEQNTINFECANEIYGNIMQMVSNGHDFDEIQKFFKPKHNELMSKFRMLAPKE